MSNCAVYIDEAGDLGVCRGTKWFVLTAVVVKKDAEQSIRQRINAIKTTCNIREIHMRNVNDFMKRAYIVRELSGLDFTYMNVVVDTTKFDASKIPTTIIAYNYVCKYLLQRVSWYLKDCGLQADIVLSARGTSRDNELIDYINNKLLPYKGNNIYSEVFGKVSAKAAASWDMLQLADVCATTLFWSYEINRYGFSVPCFSLALCHHLFQKSGRIDPYGVKFFTNDMKPDVSELRSSRICAKKERTPGATTT